MVILRILDLELDDQTNHLATDWEVSRTLAFNDVVLRSLEDYDNKTRIVFNEVLDPNIKWYARARALLSTGYTVWGNLDIFIPEVVNDLQLLEDIPSRISTPILTTDSINSKHDSTLFTINVSGFSAVGTASHDSTSYFIEDIFGNIIWSKLYDKINKDNILVDDIILQKNVIYKIRAMFHSTSGDSSQLSTVIVYINGGTEVKLLTYLDGIDNNIDNNLYIKYNSNITNITWEIISIKYNKCDIIWSSDTATTNVIIPANTLNSKEIYLIRIKTNINNSWKYIPFSTIGLNNSDINGFITNLNVSSNNHITTDTLYKYNEINIECGGTLTYVTDNGNIIYTCKDLIVPQSNIMTQVEYDATNWESVTILSDAGLTITN